MNKRVYLDLSIWGVNKTVMNEVCYDYVKPKYGENSRLCYIYTGNFIVHVKRNMFTKTLQNMLKQGLTLQIFS